MCSKYNRFLLSACLPAMALSLCALTPAYAGFEWTPPEKAVPVEVLPDPEFEMPTSVSPDPVMSEMLDENIEIETKMEVETETQELPIEIKVIDDIEDATKSAEPIEAVEEEVEIIIIEEHVQDVSPEETSIESVIIESEPIEIIEDTLTESKPIEIIEDTLTESKPIEIIEDTLTESEPIEIIEDTLTEHELENVVIEAMDVETSKAPIKEVLPEESTPTQSLKINPYPLEEEVVKADIKETIHWNTPESFDVIEGFGKDMPLALALRQIVPPRFAFSFGEDVNPGARISWQGGKPWNEVLSGALAPIGVAATIQNTKVLLRTSESDGNTNDGKEEHSAEATQGEVITPEFEGDVAAVEEAEIIEDAAEEISDTIESVEDNAEKAMEIPADNSATTEETMNEALREVYGETPPAQAEEAMPDASPVQLDETIDEEASNTMVEELLEPIEITKEQEETIPTPDMGDLSNSAGEVEIVVERSNVLDPGQVEGVQPSPFESEIISKEKKN